MDNLGKSEVDLKVLKKEKTIFIKGSKGAISYTFKGDDVDFLNNGKVLVKSYASYKTFLNLVKKGLNSVKYGHFLEVELRGLGYRFFLIKDYILLKLGYSHYIKYTIPTGIKVIGFKNKLVIYGVSKEEVNLFMGVLSKLKKIDRYKGKGVSLVGKEIALKIGKQR